MEQVLSLLREKIWVVKARGAMKRVLRTCVHCRKQMAARMNQLMGDLPRVRLIPYEPPFTYCGVDYFGPFYMKRGGRRVIEKRWGATLKKNQADFFSNARGRTVMCSLYIYTSQYLIERFTVRCLFSLRTDWESKR